MRIFKQNTIELLFCICMGALIGSAVAELVIHLFFNL